MKQQAGKESKGKKAPQLSADAKPFPQAGPVVFMFQPTYYETVTGARLEEWERLMAERVGIAAVAPAREISQDMRPPHPTLSGCDYADDCDVGF
jgi:hypothetical protein